MTIDVFCFRLSKFFKILYPSPERVSNFTVNLVAEEKENVKGLS